jgi:hypothetical protein
MFIVMHTKSGAGFEGEIPVRFPANTPPEFVARSPFAMSPVDPDAVYGLRKLESKKKSREPGVISGHAMPIPLGSTASARLMQDVLPGELSKYGASSIKMITAPLSPGEYAVSPQTDQRYSALESIKA